MRPKCEPTSHRSPVTGEPTTSHRSASHRSTRHWAVYHWSIRHQSTSHRSSSHQSVSDHQAPVTGHQSTYQAPVIMQQTIGNEYQVANQSIRGSEQSLLNEPQNPTTSKSVLIPLEPDFSQMSDPSIIIGPPSNTWLSTERHTSQTRQNRRDQPKKNKTQNKEE